jgi:hypothetical protein
VPAVVAVVPAMVVVVPAVLLVPPPLGVMVGSSGAQAAPTTATIRGAANATVLREMGFMKLLELFGPLNDPLGRILETDCMWSV